MKRKLLKVSLIAISINISALLPVHQSLLKIDTLAATLKDTQAVGGRENPSDARTTKTSPRKGRRPAAGDAKTLSLAPKSGEKPAPNGDVQMWVERAKNYVMTERGIEDERIVALAGGCRSEFTVQLWIVPRGARAPALEPTRPCRLRARLEDAPETSGLFVRAHYRTSPAFDLTSNSVSLPETTITVCSYNNKCAYPYSPREQDITRDKVEPDSPPLPIPKKIDEYGEIYPTEEQLRLDSLVVALQEEPGARGYIIVYGRTK